MTRPVLALVAGLSLALSPAEGPRQQPQVIVLQASKELIPGLAFSPDGKTIAVGVNQNAFRARVRFWDVATGKEKAPLEPGITTVQSLAYAPDGKTLAIVGDASLPMGSAPGTVVLW